MTGNIYSALRVLLSTSHALTHSVLTITLWKRLLFYKRETEAQRGEAVYLSLCSWEVIETRFDLRLSSSKALGFSRKMEPIGYIYRDIYYEGLTRRSMQAEKSRDVPTGDSRRAIVQGREEMDVPGQAESKFALFLLFCSIQALQRLNDTRWHW